MILEMSYVDVCRQDTCEHDGLSSFLQKFVTIYLQIDSSKRTTEDCLKPPVKVLRLQKLLWGSLAGILIIRSFPFTQEYHQSIHVIVFNSIGSWYMNEWLVSVEI